MAIPVLSNALLLNLHLDGGISGTSNRKNERVSMVSGEQDITVLWPHSLREWEIGFVPLRRSTFQQVEALWEITDAGGYGFLLQDPKDWTVSATEGVVADLGGGVYQAYKRYTTPSFPGAYYDRKLTRLKEASIIMTVSGTPTMPSDIDPDTGRFTLAGSPSANTVAWSGNFYVPVHFMSDIFHWKMVAPGADPEVRFMVAHSLVLEEIRE